MTTIADFHRHLDAHPDDLDMRFGLGLWLANSAESVPCERCKGRGRLYGGAPLASITAQPVSITCLDCAGHGVTDRPNLLAAQCQWWMCREEKWPELYPFTYGKSWWAWWDISRLNLPPPRPWCAVEKAIYDEIARKGNQLAHNSTRFTFRLDAESTLQQALLHLDRIAATAEVPNYLS